jgi:molybdopterin-containing oxidoreductase family iron-sulfur binding subunit
MAACPYGARSFNFFDPRPYIDQVNPELPTRTKGVVEKCTFCVERIDKGLAPVCVEASGGAIMFGDLDDPQSEVRKALRENFAIRRKVELGTGPNIYYIFRGGGAGA